MVFSIANVANYLGDNVTSAVVISLAHSCKAGSPIQVALLQRAEMLDSQPGGIIASANADTQREKESG